jgi:hypothetical protein
MTFKAMVNGCQDNAAPATRQFKARQAEPGAWFGQDRGLSAKGSRGYFSRFQHS